MARTVRHADFSDLAGGVRGRSRRIIHKKADHGRIYKAGRKIRREEIANGNPTVIISPYGQQTALAVDSNGYLSSITDPAADAYLFSYTSGGLMLSMTNPNNNTYNFTHDTYGRLTRDSDPAGGSKSLARADNPTGYSVAVTTGLSRTTNYSVQKLSTGAIDRVTVYPDGTRAETITGTDGSRNATYPDGTISDLLQGPDPRFGMLIPLPESSTTTTPSGLSYATSMTRTVTLADINNPLSLTGQTDTLSINGQNWVRAFNSSGNTITVSSPVGRQAASVIDTLGRPVSIQAAGLDPTAIAYDSNGRLSAVTAGAGTNARTTNFAYDSGGFLSLISDPSGRTYGFQHDTAGRLISRTLPDGSTTGFQYDNNGNVTSITPPGRPAHVFAYTSADQDSSYIPPGGNVTNYSYNIDRQLVQITRPDGETLNFGYDAAGRLSTLTIPTGELTYGYNANTGKLNQVATSDGTTLAFTYDGFLPTSQTWSGQVSGQVGYAYDNNFRVTSTKVDGNNAVSFQYDADGLLTQVGNLALTRSSQNGLLTGTSLGSISDSRTYDTLGEVIGYAASYGSAPIFSEQYTRDQIGRITRKTETINGTTNVFGYTYDQAGRLSQVQENGTIISTYTYDANGNRLSWTGPASTINGSYDEQDHLLRYGSIAYTYTANGELQSKSDGTSYQYDVLGNLKQVTLPSGNVINYIVDGSNRRIGKVINGTLVQGFLYQDGLRPVAELDGNNNVVRLFVYVSGANVPAYMVRSGSTYRIISDQIGSPKLVIDTGTGIVAQQMDYDEFGNVVLDTNPGFQPFGFAGGIYDSDTGLVRFGARDYDPSTGRWTAKDPIAFKGGDTNLYGYALNNPINLLDPSGLDVNIVINRTNTTNNSLVSTIDVSSTVVSGTFSGYTLENASPTNSNLPLPQGTYSATSTNNIPGLTPNRILLDVPPNIATGIEIHNGNYPSQSQGCFLAGTSTSTDFVGNSVNAMAQINSIIAYDGSGRITVYVTGP